jgi:hypothetical protein
MGAVAVERSVHQALVVALEQGCDAFEIFDVAAGPGGAALVALHLGGLVDQAAVFHIRAPLLLRGRSPGQCARESEVGQYPEVAETGDG